MKYIFLILLLPSLFISCGKNGGYAQSVELVDNIQHEQHEEKVVESDTKDTVDEIEEVEEVFNCKIKLKIFKGKRFLFIKKNGGLFKVKKKVKKCKK